MIVTCGAQHQTSLHGTGVSTLVTGDSSHQKTSEGTDMAHPGFGEQRENELDLILNHECQLRELLLLVRVFLVNQKTTRRVPDNKFTSENKI